MLITLDSGDTRPLYQQIAGAVREGIAEGRLAPGERLPAGRDLAEATGVTLETVQRAYRLLAQEGLVTSRVGRGTVIAAGVDRTQLTYRPEVDALVARAASLGAGLPDVLAEVRARWPATGAP